MLTESQRQEQYRRTVYAPAQDARKAYWQSMWERSMHNPLNKKPSVPEGRISPNASVHHGDVDEFTHPNTPPPRTAWSKDPWPDARGTTTRPVLEPNPLDYFAGKNPVDYGPNAPCCKEAPFSDKDLSILTEAHGLVYGDRQRSYGHPAVDFARTAALANTLLASKLSKDLGPEDVALFMVAVKLSRECHEPARDNLVDAAGYLECRARVLRFLGTASESSKDAL